MRPRRNETQTGNGWIKRVEVEFYYAVITYRKITPAFTASAIKLFELVETRRRGKERREVLDVVKIAPTFINLR